jgi:hypothetical protein
MTSDNATVVAHGINREGGYTGALTGRRVRRMDLGLSVFDDPEHPHLPRAKIPPPADLRIPHRRTRLDGEYANATWESVRRGDDAARRLGRAIDWLHLAWLNTTALSDDLRIPALRAGFEVLLDTGNYLRLARRLSDLLRNDSAPIERAWHNLAGEPTSEELTDVAWWSVRFSFLRNGPHAWPLARRRSWATRRRAPHRSRRVASTTSDQADSRERRPRQHPRRPSLAK